jgi:hypothetical protein
VALVVEQEILWLEITVDNVHRMDLFDSSEDLMKKNTGLWLFQATFGHNIIKDFSARCVFHDQIQLPSRLNDLVQLHDVWMSDQLQDMYFSCYALHISYFHDTLFLQDLYSNALPSQDVRTQLHLAEGSLANGFAKYIMADGLCPRPC